MSLIVVETIYRDPLHPADRASAIPKCWPCLVQHNVRWVRSILSINRHRMITEFNAPDAEAVRTLYRKLGISFDQIWTAESFTPDSVADVTHPPGGHQAHNP